MVDHRQNEIVIVDGLKSYLSSDKRPCEVVRQNQVAEVPPYPYTSYTITTPVSAASGMYSEAADGALYRNILQTWSFTVQSDDQEEALSLAMRMYDFFSAAGVIYLADHNITVRQVRNVTSRDNLISIEYEYRNGLDITFGLLYSIKSDNLVSDERIETVNVGDSEIEKPSTTNELNELLEKRLDGE